MACSLDPMDAPASTEFVLDARVVKADSSHGLVLGWGIVCKDASVDYEDLQGDRIPEESMLEASLDFAKSARNAKAMHDGEPVGSIVYLWPMTTEIAKAFGIETPITGLMVAMQPDADVLAKFRDGTYTGFSIGGRRILDEVVLEKGEAEIVDEVGTVLAKYDDSEERDDHGRWSGAGGGGTSTSDHGDSNAVREKAIGVTREGDTYHFVDGSGEHVASVQGHSGLQAMLSDAGLKGIDSQVRDLRSGQSYHYKGFGAGLVDETGEPLEKYSDDQERDDHGRFGSGGGAARPTADQLNEHLKSGGAVQVSTYTQSRIYDERHAGHFSEKNGNLHVKAGKGTDQLSQGDRMMVGLRTGRYTSKRDDAEAVLKYEDDQARDEGGKWTTGGGSKGPGAEHRASIGAHKAEAARWTGVVDSHMAAINQIYNERDADKKPGAAERNQARESAANAHWDQANQAAAQANAASDRAVMARRADLASRGIDYRIEDLKSVGARIPESVMRESRASLQRGNSRSPREQERANLHASRPIRERI